MNKKETKKVIDNYGTALNEFWDRQLLKFGESNVLFGEPIGYKKVKVPKYLHIKIPVISRHYDSEYGDFEGWLLTFESKRLFKIGTETIEEPIYRKSKGATIKFNRYGNVSNITCKSPDGSGFEIGEIKEDEK